MLPTSRVMRLLTDGCELRAKIIFKILTSFIYLVALFYQKKHGQSQRKKQANIT